MFSVAADMTSYVDFAITGGSGSVLLPNSGDDVRIKLTSCGTNAAWLTITTTVNSAGSLITYLGNGLYRLRIDGTDLSVTPGVYSMHVDFFDLEDSSDWKRAGTKILTVVV